MVCIFSQKDLTSRVLAYLTLRFTSHVLSDSLEIVGLTVSLLVVLIEDVLDVVSYEPKLKQCQIKYTEYNNCTSVDPVKIDLILYD